MTTQLGPASRTPEEYDWDAEREIDFRRYWNALVERWWLPVLGLVVGALIGYAVSLGGSQLWSAQTTIYLGQPYSSSGNVALQSPQTNPSSVRQIVTSADALAAAAKAAGLKSGNALRGRVSVSAVSGNVAKVGQTPLVTVTVQGRKRAAVRAAAASLGATVVTRLGTYADRKIGNFRQEIVADEKQIAAIDDALKGPSLTSTDRLVLLLQLRPVQQDRIAATQLLVQAQQVEAPRVLTHAAAQKVTARSRRSSIAVAAVVGLIIGLLAALLWEPVAARFGRRPAA